MDVYWEKGGGGGLGQILLWYIIILYGKMAVFFWSISTIYVLPIAYAIIPKSHSNPYDYPYYFFGLRKAVGVRTMVICD